MRSTLQILQLLAVFYACAPRLAAQGSIDDQIRDEQNAIDALEQKLAPKIQPLLVGNADLRMWVSNGVPVLVTNFYNSLPSGQRLFHYDAVSETGQLKNSNGGGLGCGWYVALEGGNSAHADMDIQDLAAAVNPTGGNLDISVGFHFSFSAQIHGHVKGPPGPCSLWNAWPTCDCPLTGGAGTSVGISGEQGGTLTGSIFPRSDPKSWLGYDIRLTGPATIPITVSAGLQGLGNIGIPISINLPLGVISTASVPALVSGTGTVSVPNVLARQYSFSIQAFGLAFDGSGYSARGSVQIVWK